MTHDYDVNDKNGALDEDVARPLNDPAIFREHVETEFRVQHASGPIPLRLAEVADEHIAGGIHQFSLFFHGPSDRILPQGTYAFRHDALGSLALFIVPVIGSNHERIIYQACFSRPAPPSLTS